MSDLTRRIIVVVAVVAAVGALVLAVTSSDTGPDTAISNPQAVEQLIPGRGELEVRQAKVGIDLAPGYTGILVVNGIEIPEDQLEYVTGLNQVLFQPREGNEIEAFEPGQVCVVARFWREVETREDGRSVRWCFDVA